jgi:ribokinase
MRVAVVGHVEWIQFARVPAVPTPGEIVHATEAWEEPGGGGAVAAVQLARLAGECLFLTALGDDELGRRAHRELEELGVRVAAAWRPGPQRRAFVHLDTHGERTITVIGERMGPSAGDDLPWAELEEADAVYLTAGDAGAIRSARSARHLVATTRAIDSLVEACVELDALVASAADRGERYEAGQLDPAPRAVVRTEGREGGSIEEAGAAPSHWEAVAPQGPLLDSYGAGDAFAAGLTYGLGAGSSPSEAAELGARCGAASVTGRGPYEGQLHSP